MPKYEFKKERMTPRVQLKTCWDGSRIPADLPCPKKRGKPAFKKRQPMEIPRSMVLKAWNPDRWERNK